MLDDYVIIYLDICLLSGYTGLIWQITPTNIIMIWVWIDKLHHVAWSCYNIFGHLFIEWPYKFNLTNYANEYNNDATSSIWQIIPTNIIMIWIWIDKLRHVAWLCYNIVGHLFIEWLHGFDLTNYANEYNNDMHLDWQISSCWMIML